MTKYAYIGPNNAYAAIDNYTFRNIQESFKDNCIPYTIHYDSERDIEAISIYHN